MLISVALHKHLQSYLSLRPLLFLILLFQVDRGPEGRQGEGSKERRAGRDSVEECLPSDEGLEQQYAGGQEDGGASPIPRLCRSSRGPQQLLAGPRDPPNLQQRRCHYRLRGISG